MNRVSVQLLAFSSQPDRRKYEGVPNFWYEEESPACEISLFLLKAEG